MTIDLDLDSLRDDDERLLTLEPLESRKLRAKGPATIPVYLKYPRRGSWSGDNQLGFEMPFKPDENNEQTILKLDEWGFPLVWTVSLGFRFERDLVAGEAFDALALVDIGSGGIIQQIEVDWVNGTMFSVPMNALNIKARWEAEAFAAVPDGVQISVLLSRGAQSPARATRTQPKLVAAGPATSTFTRIPPFAKSLQILPAFALGSNIADVFASTTTIIFAPNSVAAGGQGAISGDFVFPAGSKIPIPAFAHYWAVSNTAVAPIALQGIFNLFAE